MATEKRKDCDNCKNSDRPSYEWPCTACTTSFGGPPTKWESIVPIHADMVEVVRCKDCMHYVLHALACRNEHMNGVIGMDGFCSYGERKNE